MIYVRARLKAMWAVLIVLLFVFSGMGDSAFDAALRDGAVAKVVVEVVDDAGLPVTNAAVKVTFVMDNGVARQDLESATGCEGVAEFIGRTNKGIQIRVEKEGYYGSTDSVCLIAMGQEHDVKLGKWQPWGMTRRIILFPKKNCSAVMAGDSQLRFTHETNKWLGFDLQMYDFVEPYGRGKRIDFEVLFVWDGHYRARDYNGMKMCIRFPAKGSGAYYDSIASGSDFRGVYQADPATSYKQSFEYSECPVRDQQKRIVKYERELFDPGKALVGRSRCEYDDDGSLKSAEYFMMREVRFACDRQRGVAIGFVSAYNPIPNNTNLEPKR